MATQSLVKQTILFVSPASEFDQNSIEANSLIQALASNSVGTALVESYQQYKTWNGSAWTFSSFFQITCFVSTSFQTTIQNNMAM